MIIISWTHNNSKCNNRHYSFPLNFISFHWLGILSWFYYFFVIIITEKANHHHTPNLFACLIVFPIRTPKFDTFLVFLSCQERNISVPEFCITVPTSSFLWTHVSGFEYITKQPADSIYRHHPLCNSKITETVNISFCVVFRP